MRLALPIVRLYQYNKSMPGGPIGALSRLLFFVLLVWF
jgi:hypothetical protein